MTINDKRLIEDYLPIEAISAATSREKSVRKGHISTLHLWWVRRPLVACRAAVYGALAPAARFLPQNRPEGKRASLGRANAAKFVIAPKAAKRVRFEVVEAATAKGLDFDPEAGSKGGNTTCPCCGTVADSNHVKAEGCAGRIRHQLMAVVCKRTGKKSKVYLSINSVPNAVPDEQAIMERIKSLCHRTDINIPNELIINDANNVLFCVLYGLKRWNDLFSARQMLCLLTFVSVVCEAVHQVKNINYTPEQAKIVAAYLSFVINRITDWNSSLCSWSPENTGGAKIGHTFSRQPLPMIWDYAESAIGGNATGCAKLYLDWVIKGLNECFASERHVTVLRGSAASLAWSESKFDAIITDPPYYDYGSYANLSDFFYIWMKHAVGQFYPEHFSLEGTPKKTEAMADATRHSGSKNSARQFYEEILARSFSEANRVLKPSGEMVVVYAHKTTLGWTTLIDALRRAGFIVSAAWPLDTEMKTRWRGIDSAALASSIFLVARKRDTEVETAG